MAFFKRVGFKINEGRVSAEITFDGIVEMNVRIELADFVGKGSEFC